MEGFNTKLGDWLSRLSEIRSQYPDLTENLVFINNKINIKDDLDEEELKLINQIISSFTLLNLLVEKNDKEYGNIVEFLTQ